MIKDEKKRRKGAATVYRCSLCKDFDASSPVKVRIHQKSGDCPAMPNYRNGTMPAPMLPLEGPPPLPRQTPEKEKKAAPLPRQTSEKNQARAPEELFEAYMEKRILEDVERNLDHQAFELARLAIELAKLKLGHLPKPPKDKEWWTYLCEAADLVENGRDLLKEG